MHYGKLATRVEYFAYAEALRQATVHESKKKSVVQMQSRAAPLWDRPDFTR